MRCAVFRDLWGTRGQPGQGNEEQIFVHEQRFWCVRVIIVQNGIKIYINKEKIPLDLSLSLSLVAVVVSRRAFSLSRRSLLEREVFTSFVCSIFCFLFRMRVSVRP